MLKAKRDCIRERIGIGYYDYPVITRKIANMLVESELKKIERRKYPRIVVKDGYLIL